LACFVHSFNVFLVLIIIGFIFFFNDQPGINRILSFCKTTISCILFGGIYYIIDLFFGSGWILSL
jgi:hypothetical protein